uniref:1-acyl-sn-glycerol-3-phosphate acyltransferase alpha-like n=1 Tax=Styela clava TaxID=7725 RepID=UPI001939972E|nr:1-acyl-sn-glycerol-3-phosphate acyltransferase alpha-like [Styela clava]
MLFPIDISIASPIHCLLVAGFASFSLVYWTCAAFRFNIRMGLYYLYFICMATMLLPFMLWNGRSRKNMLWCSFAQRVSGWLFGLHGEVSHIENLVTNGPSIIVSNHQSAIDTTGMGKLFTERSTILAKKELLYVGPFGLALWLSGFVFIERSNKKQSYQILDDVANKVKNEGLCVWIFPEGTRNTNEEMLQFKKGAFHLAIKAQAPIVPVVFSSYKNFFNPKANIFTSGKYVMEILPPVSTENLTLDDISKLSNDVRSQMMDVFNRLSANNYN